MSDFSTLGLGQKHLGGTVTNSRGVSVTPSATADTKGSYAQLISAANNTVESTGVLVTIGGTTATTHYYVDLAIGAAASEVIIAADLFCEITSGKQIFSYFLPISIPTGTRVSARCKANKASAGAVQVTLNLMGQGFLPSSPLQRITSYTSAEGGSPPQYYGFLLDGAATANAKNTTWTQLSASTTNPIRMLALGVGSTLTAPTQTVQWLFDIGIGAAGSETTLIPNLSQQLWFSATGSFTGLSPLTYLLPVSIPAGTRLAARCQSSVTSGGERAMTLSAYGID